MTRGVNSRSTSIKRIPVANTAIVNFGQLFQRGYHPEYRGNASIGKGVGTATKGEKSVAGSGS